MQTLISGSAISSLIHALRRPLVLVALLSASLLGLKVVSVVDGFSNSALAAEEDDAAAQSEQMADGAADMSAKAASDADAGDADDTVMIEKPAAQPILDPAMMTQSELALLRDLSKRRNDLDAREQDIDMRSRLLEATEQRVESKIAELKQMENYVKSLLVQHEDQENEKIGSVVRVYEKMKPADAARIIEGLDMGIQVDVARRMSELRMAPILGKMSPKAAQRLTTELATKQTVDLSAAVN
ncbi:MAG: hypothetical protein AAF862_03135 [Pseudomonadota bacterium]